MSNRAAKAKPISQIRRHPERGSYQQVDAHAVLDAGQIAHVSFAVDGQPFVIPMLYVRLGDKLLLHGGVASRLLKHLAGGAPCCIAVTHLDGWVLARSHFHHSANYRSIVIFGSASIVADPEKKAEALAYLVDALIPGRAAETRPADAQELAATLLLEVAIDDFSVKTRTGEPKDHPDDLSSPAWAGVVPLSLQAGKPIPAPDLPSDVPLPSYVNG